MRHSVCLLVQRRENIYHDDIERPRRKAKTSTEIDHAVFRSPHLDERNTLGSSAWLYFMSKSYINVSSFELE